MNPVDPNEPPEDLIDSISHELFEDPILLPCGNTISRNEIAKCLAIDPKKLCPICRKPMADFDPATAVPNRFVANAVDDFKRKMKVKQEEEAKAPPVDNQKWSATILPVVDSLGTVLSISEFRLDLEGASVIPKPGLFIGIMDKSGSMMGDPWAQVQAGLRHIVSLASRSPFVKVEVIAYQSVAEIVNLGPNLASAINAIDMQRAGGGNNEIDAFAKVADILSKYYCSDVGPIPEGKTGLIDASSVTIAFMTDGQAEGWVDDNSRRQMANRLRVILADKWLGPVTVHSVGFGRACDKIFLEEMLKTGHTIGGAPLEGTFRYAEPEDNSDTLSRKLASLFESISKASTIPIELKQNVGSYIDQQSVNGETCAIQYPIGQGGKGSYCFWISRFEGDIQISDGMFCNIHLGEKVIHVPLIDGYKLPNYKLIRAHLYAKWLSKLTDNLAAELLGLTKVDKAAYGLEAFGIHCLLVDRNATNLKASCQTGDKNDVLIQGTIQRLDIISRDAIALHAGLQVNTGHLADLRFGAQYLLAKPAAKTPALPVVTVAPVAALPHVAAANYDERTVYYARRGSEAAELRRNPLQTMIVELDCDMYKRDQETPERIRQLITKADCGDLICTDRNGNNTLMLAAYCGHRTLTDAILKRGPKVHILEIDFIDWLQQKNNDGETALTLAVKARGYDDTVQLLIKAGAEIPGDRQDALYRYCIDHRFRRTAKLMVNPNSVITHVNPTMTEDYIDIAFRSGISKPESLAKMSLQSYLSTAIKKRLPSLVELVLGIAATLPFERLELTTAAMEDLCVLDDTVPELVTIANSILNYLKTKFPDVSTGMTKSFPHPQLIKFINQPLNESGDTLLFRAADRGSPKMLAMCLSLGAEVDKANVLGNTPLWIACERRWPCIIDTLLEKNANPNHTNLKGNSPMTTICQKGNKANAEKLLACGADPNNINRNGDSLILICCRNGQHEVLKLLLERAEPKTIEHVAHIDGFGAMLASTEANKPECIRLLHENGLSLEVKTAPDNQIIAGATSLHLAAYYGRSEAAQMLLELGANVNTLDINGQTALHTAVIHGQAAMVRLLRSRCNVDIRDKQGNTAAGYCRNEELRTALIDPLLTPLMRLSRGRFTKVEQEKVVNLLLRLDRTRCGLDPQEIMSIRNTEGRTPLIEAVLAGNMTMVEVYLKCKADVQARDYYGVPSYLWAQFIGNARLRARLTEKLPPQIFEQDEALERVKRTIAQSSLNARTLFIGACPSDGHIEITNSNLSSRMLAIVSQLKRIEANQKQEAQEELHKVNKWIHDVNEEKPSSSKQLVQQSDTQSILNFLSWDAKVFTVAKIASGTTNLSPQQIGAIYMYDALATAVNSGIERRDNLHRDYICRVSSALEVLRPYEGEVFIGVPSLPDRSLFSVGAEFSCLSFLSASSSWCVAVEHVPGFSDKRQGVVFLIHHKTGRSISQLSRFAYDMEIIFPIGSKFRVVKWYRGDVICLGQANIREHTFKIKTEPNGVKRDEEELSRYTSTNAALIIEMVEL